MTTTSAPPTIVLIHGLWMTPLSWEKWGYAVPGPGRTLFQAGLANFKPNAATKVNVKNNDRAPLLLVAGEKDHVVPASTVRAAFKLDRHSTAVTEYKEFAGRSHFLVGEPGWEEVADYALDWAVAHAMTPAAV